MPNQQPETSPNGKDLVSGESTEPKGVLIGIDRVAKKHTRRAVSLSIKLIRLSTFLLIVFAALAVFSVRRAVSQAKRVAMDVGEDLIALSDEGHVGQVMRLRLNDQPIYFTNASTDLSVKDVLNRFEVACKLHADGLEAAFFDFPRAVDAATPKLPEAGFPGVGLLREEEDNRGMVACFAQGQDRNQAAVWSSVADFARSGDLGKIGQMRYIVARREAGASRTHVIALWTAQGFDLRSAFPESGDAPGSDVPKAVRPSNSRRLLSAAADGLPYGIRVYDLGTAPVEKVLAEYDEGMSRLGWQPIHAVREHVALSRAFERDGVDLLISARQENGRTILAVVETSMK